MANFDPAIKLLLLHEGGYVDNPNDPGGKTSYGISLRFLADHPEIGDFNHDGHVDGEDIKNMTVEDAMQVYKTEWWDKFSYGLINDQTIATKVFDFSVNMGAVRAHKLLQQALNTSFGLKLTCDGILGNATRSVLNAASDGDQEQLIITSYCDQAWAFYQGLITNNPKLAVFKNGWKNRAYSISTANSIGS